MRPQEHPFYLNQCFHINKLVCLNSLNITCISKLTCCYELMSDAIRYLSLYTTAKLNVDWLLSSRPRENQKRSDTVVIGWKNKKDCKYIESLIFLHFRYHHIAKYITKSSIYKLVGPLSRPCLLVSSINGGIDQLPSALTNCVCQLSNSNHLIQSHHHNQPIRARHLRCFNK